MQEVLPTVVRAQPNVLFEVAGKGVPPALLAMANANIRFAGLVPDAYDFVRSAAIVVVPLLSGGGIKIKTLEAMACGCPIVATSIGAEETGAVSGEHMLIADRPEEFAQHVVAILHGSAIGARLGANARLLALEKFSWKAKWMSLEKLLTKAVQKHQAALTNTEDFQK